MSSYCYDKRKSFLADMFTKAPVKRHGFVVSGGTRRRAWEIGDFATSGKPLKEFLPYVLETYQTSLEYYALSGNDGIPMTDMNYGTHIFPSAFGAKVFFVTKSSPCCFPLAMNAVEADKLKEPEVENCRPLARIIEMAKLVQSELGTDVIVCPPDLQTGFDIACMIWDKKDILCSLYEAPDAVKALTGKCSRLVIKFLKTLKHECPNVSLNAYAWSPLGPLISNDECGNMNNEMFETFCLPELISLSKEFGSLGMHCCATAQHQFESFKKIPNFYAFNRVPTADSFEKDKALNILGGSNGPVMILGAYGAGEMLEIQRQAPQGTRFIFIKFGAPSVNEARQWLDDAYELTPVYEGPE